MDRVHARPAWRSGVFLLVRHPRRAKPVSEPKRHRLCHCARSSHFSGTRCLRARRVFYPRADRERPIRQPVLFRPTIGALHRQDPRPDDRVGCASRRVRRTAGIRAGKFVSVDSEIRGSLLRDVCRSWLGRNQDRSFSSRGVDCLGSLRCSSVAPSASVDRSQWRFGQPDILLVILRHRRDGLRCQIYAAYHMAAAGPIVVCDGGGGRHGCVRNHLGDWPRIQCSLARFVANGPLARVRQSQRLLLRRVHLRCPGHAKSAALVSGSRCRPVGDCYGHDHRAIGRSIMALDREASAELATHHQAALWREGSTRSATAERHRDPRCLTIGGRGRIRTFETVARLSDLTCARSDAFSLSATASMTFQRRAVHRRTARRIFEPNWALTSPSRVW